MLIARKYAQIYIEKQGKKNKIGTEMIKKERNTRRLWYTENSFACTNVTASLMTAIFFPEISLPCMASC